MWSATAELPEQLLAAVTTGTEVGLPVGAVTNVVVLGVGADALAGDLLAAVTADELRVPLAVVRSATLPAFVGTGSLVFALSCSGETPSTLAAAERAWEVGATVAVVAQGGRLAELADRAGSPSIPVPAGLACARVALGALAVPVLVVLERLGLLAGVQERVLASASGLAHRRDELVADDNVALDIARRIGRTVPVVHGSPGSAAVAAARWKDQVNENAKSPAFWAAHPELDYNEVAGWGQSGDVTRQILTLIELRHRAESPATARRFELVGEALQEVVADIVPVWARGEDELARFFDLALVGDFVSLQLAAAEGVDPGPVPVVEEIEREIAHGAITPPGR
jgi:glucose/mannose-6-phosphate isomerase